MVVAAKAEGAAAERLVDDFAFAANQTRAQLELVIQQTLSFTVQ